MIRPTGTALFLLLLPIHLPVAAAGSGSTDPGRCDGEVDVLCTHFSCESYENGWTCIYVWCDYWIAGSCHQLDDLPIGAATEAVALPAATARDCSGALDVNCRYPECFYHQGKKVACGWHWCGIWHDGTCIVD